MCDQHVLNRGILLSTGYWEEHFSRASVYGHRKYYHGYGEDRSRQTGVCKGVGRVCMKCPSTVAGLSWENKSPLTGGRQRGEDVWTRQWPSWQITKFPLLHSSTLSTHWPVTAGLFYRTCTTAGESECGQFCLTMPLQVDQFLATEVHPALLPYTETLDTTVKLDIWYS